MKCREVYKSGTKKRQWKHEENDSRVETVKNTNAKRNAEKSGVEEEGDEERSETSGSRTAPRKCSERRR